MSKKQKDKDHAHAHALGSTTCPHRLDVAKAR